MQWTVVKGVAMWSAWQPERNLFLNSYFIKTPEGNLVVDPLALTEADAAEIAAAGGVQWIVVTNREREREAVALRVRFGAAVAAAMPDAAELSLPVDLHLHDGAMLASARVVALDGLRTSGEFALFFEGRRAVVVGEALCGDPAGSVRLMPDESLADPEAATLSLRSLRALNPLHLLVGDGTPVFHRAFEVLCACLDARAGVFTNRVNLADLMPEVYLEDPPRYRSSQAEVGWLLGATRLGYRIARLEPGQAFCPMHWHTAEEELFIVWDGTPTLQSPRGQARLRRGDLVAFPTNASGAHKLCNESEGPCTVIMISNIDPSDVAFYPDSKKVGVRSTRTLVRSEPILDYYDGEV
jgi:uncharacterized cupin superfamily protein